MKLQHGAEHNGTREELVLKFFAYKEARGDFRGAVTKFLTDYMARAKDEIDIDASRALFTSVVAALSRLTDGKPFLRANVKTTPLNQLEAVMVATGELIDGGQNVQQLAPGWTDDPELVKASTGGTNTAAMLRARIDRAKQLLSDE